MLVPCANRCFTEQDGTWHMTVIRDPAGEVTLGFNETFLAYHCSPGIISE